MSRKFQDNEPVRTILVHEFIIGDVEDPDLYAADPLLKWQESEEGQWIINNSIDTPYYHHQPDEHEYGYKFVIYAKLQGAALTEWLLRTNK